MSKIKVDKLPCYFWYILSSLMFEGAISVLFVLIGMVFFGTNFYYYLTSAFLGGMWSYRLHHMYRNIRKISYLSKLEAEEYLQKYIFEGEGHRLRRYLSIPFVIADAVLLIVLYYSALCNYF